MGEKIEAFQEQRRRMNDRILATGTPQTQRFWALDSRVYESGALDVRTKEMLGLVASTVLRCDDCIAYHVLSCAKAGVTLKQIVEVFDVALIVGGSITIPHIRRAHGILQELEESGEIERE